MHVEVWYDERCASAKTRLGELRALGITGVRLMANREAIRNGDGYRRPSFDESLKLSVAQAARWVTLVREHGMRPTLTLWPQSRDRQHANDLAAYVRDVHAAAPLDALELDVEGFGWYKGLSSSERIEAGEHLHHCLHEAGLHIPVYATTYSGAIGVCVASLPWVDGWTLQAYAQYRAKHDGYSWDGRYGPGAMQALAARKLERAGVRSRVMMGLAAYRQRFPRHTEQEAMQASFDAASSYANTICYWSSKWLRPHHPAAAIVQGLASSSINDGVTSRLDS